MKLEGQANKYRIDVELRLEKANKNLITNEDEMKENVKEKYFLQSSQDKYPQVERHCDYRGPQSYWARDA